MPPATPSRRAASASTGSPGAASPRCRRRAGAPRCNRSSGCRRSPGWPDEPRKGAPAAGRARPCHPSKHRPPAGFRRRLPTGSPRRCARASWRRCTPAARRSSSSRCSSAATRRGRGDLRRAQRSVPRLDRRTGGLEVAALPSLARLEVIPFAPLVPRVHEHQVFLGAERREAAQHTGEPLLVEIRRSAPDDRCVIPATRRIVPARRHSGKALVVDPGLRQHRADHLVIIVDIVPLIEIAGESERAGIAPVRLPAERGREVVPVGLELDRGIEAQCVRIVALVGKAFDSAQVDFADAQCPCRLAPDLGRPRRIGEPARPVHQKDRLAVDADVPLIAERTCQPLHVAPVVLLTILLGDQDLRILPVPPSRPVLIGPAEAERKPRLSRRENLVHRSLEQPVAAEPVVVIAEAEDAVLLRKLGLCGAGFRQAQVVETEIRWEVRLMVSGELRARAYDVGPLGEALAPPPIILRDRVELGKVECDDARRHRQRVSTTTDPPISAGLSVMVSPPSVTVACRTPGIAPWNEIAPDPASYVYLPVSAVSTSVWSGNRRWNSRSYVPSSRSSIR